MIMFYYYLIVYSWVLGRWGDYLVQDFRIDFPKLVVQPSEKRQWKASSTMVPLPPHEEGQTITPQKESLQRAGKLIHVHCQLILNICQHNPFTLTHCTTRYAQLLVSGTTKTHLEPLRTVLACATLPFSWTKVD